MLFLPHGKDLVQPGCLRIVYTRYSTRFGVCAALFCVLFALAGCGDMVMLDKGEVVRPNDPREDIKLQGISTDITSGGLLLQRVDGSEAVYSQSRNLLNIAEIDVNTMGPDHTTQGITQARKGIVYLAPDPVSKRKRSDMVFSGDVNYRAPAKDRPNSDSLQLKTEELIYDNQAEEFQGTSTHTVVMLPPGKRPMYMSGSKLRVPRDMRRFSMVQGSLGPDPSTDTKAVYSEKIKELNAAAGPATGIAAPARPTPIVVEQAPAAPVRPTPIEVQPIEAAPPRMTPIPAPPVVASPTPIAPANLAR